jgi:hypothetical protein
MGMPPTHRKDPTPPPAPASPEPTGCAPARGTAQPRATRELGGVDGPEPTRFGDWEKNGRCIDF